MKSLSKSFTRILLLLLFLSGVSHAQKPKTIEKSFDGIKTFNADLVLGSCEITKSKNNKINIRVEYTYDDEDYEVYIEERNNRIVVEEDILTHNPRGESNWYIEIPDDADVKFKSATGNLYLENLNLTLDASSGTGNISIEKAKGEFELNSGTGNVILKNSSGDFKLNSGTGNVEADNCAGEFDANSGTGSVEMKMTKIEKYSKFNSGTGDCDITLMESPMDDIEINSGTGDAILDYRNNDLKGTFYLSCNERSGDIICPVKFDDESRERHGSSYTLKKMFQKGDGPRIKISTGTGTAELRID